MVVKLGTLGDFVYLRSKLIACNVLDSLCEAIGWGPLCTFNLSLYKDLNSEYSKIELRLFVLK